MPGADRIGPAQDEIGFAGQEAGQAAFFVVMAEEKVSYKCRVTIWIDGGNAGVSGQQAFIIANDVELVRAKETGGDVNAPAV